jgi:uncharacterized protein YyaL (SSP411 family)
LLNNAEFLNKPSQIVLIGDKNHPTFQSLRRATYAASLPNRVVLTLPPGAPLPADHPAFGKGLVDGKPAAYVCDGPVCSLPITDPVSLLEALSGA